jgi:hypothetical protein
MKTTVHYLLLSGIAAGLVTAGCSTQVNRAIPDWPKTRTTPTGVPVGSQVEGKAARPPVVASPEQNKKIESVVRLVLDAHSFVPPIFIEGPDAVRWAISTRPGSDREVVMASLKMPPEGEISVELLLYAHVGSTWALLGHLFRGATDQEAHEMNKQIRERLGK